MATEYNTKILQIAGASPPDAASILALNDFTQATLATLEALSNSYAAMPAAHRDLIAVASDKSTGYAGLIALGAEANRLKGLMEELAAANAATAFSQ